jgi:secreted trypsin-like serine protease
VRRRPLALFLLTATLLVAAPAPPVASQAGPGVTTRVIGGRDATRGEFPYMAALVYADGGTVAEDLLCGATVLSPSWVLTAAHCVTDRRDEYPNTYPGPTLDYVGPQTLEVATGLTALDGSDGQRIAVASIHPHPSSTGIDNDWDFALLRLARPTTAPGVALIGATEGSLEAAGTTARVAGWGWNGTDYPLDLQTATFPIIANSTCATIYPEGRTAHNEPTEFRAQSMLCAGRLEGGTDSCRGDSGGPLVVEPSGSHPRLVGVVSWGDSCAEPNLPGIYSRVSAARSWIGTNSRFGPFAPDAVSYVVRQYVDLAGRWPTASELDRWVKAFRAGNPPSPTQLPVELLAAPAWRDIAPPITRLYTATFLRNPETAGLTYWVGPGRAGRTLVDIATYFAGSPEFINRYGALDDGAFVDRIYANVFGRTPDAGGRAFWVGRLGGGLPRGVLLAQLSDSSEYRNRTATSVSTLTTWFGLLRTVPTSTQITNAASLSTSALVDQLRATVAYAARFNG